MSSSLAAVRRGRPAPGNYSSSGLISSCWMQRQFSRGSNLARVGSPPRCCATWRWTQRLPPQFHPLSTVFRFPLKSLHFKLRTDQYAIRRVEFDDWLLQRSKSHFVNHTVKTIVLEQDRYLIDGEFSAKYLIGAGGTHCPVNQDFFSERAWRGNQGVVDRRPGRRICV